MFTAEFTKFPCRFSQQKSEVCRCMASWCIRGHLVVMFLCRVGPRYRTLRQVFHKIFCLKTAWKIVAKKEPHLLKNGLFDLNLGAMPWKERCLFGCLFVRSHVFLLQWDDRSLQISLWPYCQLHPKKSRCYQPHPCKIRPAFMSIAPKIIENRSHTNLQLVKIQQPAKRLQLCATSCLIAG